MTLISYQRRFIVALTVVFQLVINGFGQTVCPVKTFAVDNIRGSVYSAGVDKLPVSKTKIELSNLKDEERIVASTLTDSKGGFEFAGITSGRYRLIVYFIVNGEEVAPKFDSVILKVGRKKTQKRHEFRITLGINCFETKVDRILTK